MVLNDHTLLLSLTHFKPNSLPDLSGTWLLWLQALGALARPSPWSRITQKNPAESPSPLREPHKSPGLSAEDALSSSESPPQETESRPGEGPPRERGHYTTHPHFNGEHLVFRRPASLRLTRWIPSGPLVPLYQHGQAGKGSRN